MTIVSTFKRRESYSPNFLRNGCLSEDRKCFFFFSLRKQFSNVEVTFDLRKRCIGLPQ